MKKEYTKPSYWVQLLLLPVYALSGLIPRNKRLWVFGSTFGRRFADNPRYLYLYLTQNVDREKIRPVWISRDREILQTLNENGCEAYHVHSLKGALCCLRAGVYFYDNYPKDISHWLSAGAKKINLWHGVPLKKIQMDNIHDQVRHPVDRRQKALYALRRFTDEKPSDYIVATSEFYAPVFMSAFATQNVLTTGYPRTDVFTGGKIKNLLLPCERKSYEKITSQSGRKKVFLYMPTFRDSERIFFEKVDLQRLHVFLRSNNMLLCVKLHCKSKLKKEFEKLQGDNIEVIDPNADPYVYIKSSDILITDYSSIYFDYLLSGKPIIFFDYDLKEYLENSREMYFEYEEFTPGPKAEDQKGLEERMLEAAHGAVEGMTDKYSEIAYKAFGNNKEHSSERLVKAVVNILKKKEGGR